MACTRKTFLAGLGHRPRIDICPAKPFSEEGDFMRVLIIEDNWDAADSLRKLLSLLGHEVRVAYTGPGGVREAQEWRPDMVICDIGLPGLDGYGVALELRRLSV